MERSLKEIVKEVGKEYEMEDDIINEIIKKLQKEFYVKLKHMKNLSIETWKSLDLPINLYYVLNELYQSALNEQQANQPQSQPQQPPQNTINYQNQQSQIISQSQPQRQYQPQQLNEIRNNNSIQKNENQIFNSIDDQNDDSLQNVVYNDLSILFSEIDNLDKSRQVFKQIYKIITNIAHNPNDEKFRRFNINKFLSN